MVMTIHITTTITAIIWTRGRTPITVIRMDIILDQATMSHMSTTMTMYGMILDRMVEQLSLYWCACLWLWDSFSCFCQQSG